MFFKKNKQAVEKPPLLKKENIIINAKAADKDDAINQVGKILFDSGYVLQEYIQGMHEREKTFATYMGNYLALPHGVEQVKDAIVNSGIAIMIFPDGVDWDGNDAKIVIGIAGKGGEHMTILANIATKLIDINVCEQLIASDQDTIYDILTSEA
ncbi:MAG: PTS sugar transporter subunit IIA [Erysipelotrichaceae bacterium]|nr:PTS sugar transporter subunit IIA [Erysipelotrichaceae bacterium]MDD3809520.1 PTS sugar transporter subunit IIA [Erysipelotrichaceae bacterium]